MFRGRSASQLNVEKSSQIKNHKIHNSYESESILTPRNNISTTQNNNGKGLDINNNHSHKTDYTSIVK